MLVRLHGLGWVMLCCTELDWFRVCCIGLCCVELCCVVFDVFCWVCWIFSVLDCVGLSVLVCVVLACINLCCMCHVGWIVSGKAWSEVLVCMNWS